MGNQQTQTNIGDFQQGVGQVTSSIGVISSYIGAFILVCFAILFAYLAFVPTSMTDMGSQHICTTDKDCFNDEICSNNKCSGKPGPKEKHPWFLLGTFIFIALAIFSVWYARTLRDVAYSSRTGAQVVGLMGEAELARDIFKFKSRSRKHH